MKNVKRLSCVVMLIGTIAVLISSCALKLNTEQQALYDARITAVVALATLSEIPASTVETELKAMNKAFKLKGFKVVDKKAGTPIAKGTKADDLRKRFIPKKA